ncbi:uncharacterized protein LOC114530658 [Dendronephthya gigantea]|uniref:uncharacterized protein LOC114530658 n=1 Tax=Dendronephthya gigantea TaxID=151771 RepID=UPI00106C8B33|nr:uncharacterized protein LOC114530658 [Dendronephthya gigantea]
MTLRVVVLVKFFLFSVLSAVSLSNDQVYLVSRNATDYFRVGKSGCRNNESVCTSSATCNRENGLCRCDGDKPTFRNPVIKFSNSRTVYGDGYGCVDNEIVRRGVTHCPFGPFQVIPHGPTNSATQFTHDTRVTLKSCTLTKALAKSPDNSKEMSLQWLNESFVDLTVVSNILHFKWKRSVFGLKGTIITLKFLCLLDSGAYLKTCLRAKIHGIWQRGVTDIDPTVPSTKQQSSQMTYTVLSNGKSKTTKQLYMSKSAESNITLIAVLAASVALNVVLGIVTGFLCRKYCRNQRKKTKAEDERASRGESSSRIEERNPYDPVMIDKPFTISALSGQQINGNLSGQRARASQGNALSRGTERNLYDPVKISKSYTWSGQQNNGNSYDETHRESYYQPLQRNHLDQIEENTYQGLTTLHNGNQPHQLPSALQ